MGQVSLKSAALEKSRQRTMSFVDFGRARCRRTLVLELVGFSRVPENCIVKRRNFHVLNDSSNLRSLQSVLADVDSREGAYFDHAGRRSIRSPPGMVIEICRNRREGSSASEVSEKNSCLPYLDFRVMGNRRLTILVRNDGLEDAEIVLLHRVSISTPVVCEGITEMRQSRSRSRGGR